MTLQCEPQNSYLCKHNTTYYGKELFRKVYLAD